jgi:hypothetical protein
VRRGVSNGKPVPESDQCDSTGKVVPRATPQKTKKLRSPEHGEHVSCWISPSGDVEEHQHTMYIFRHVSKINLLGELETTALMITTQRRVERGIPYRHT